MTRTGVFATEEEVKKIKRLHKRARSTPAIALSVRHGIESGGFSGEAYERLKQAVHAAALQHGLPEIPGYYGIDLDSREFLR